LVNAQLKSLPAGGMIWHDISSPVWGIDRHTRKPSPNQKDYEEAAAQFNAEMKRRRESIRREFVNFNAAGPLSRWSTLEPDAFAEFAIQFLKALDGKNPAIRFEFWFFASCIWSALLHIRPEIACHCYECGTYVIEISGAGLSREIRDLWAAELNTSGGVINLRRRLLDEAPDDERLLWHAVAAHYAGNQRELVRVATEFLAAETARDRALGATLLAFQGDLASEAKLAQCVDSDASFWVREHAKWCFDVCAAEWACKQRYREILSSGSLHELAVGLAELGPALTHMSRSWRSVIEKETHWPNSDRRMVIYLQNFWWRWKRTNSNTENTEVCNHRLRHYCRGERLKEGLTNRQAPWWKLDD